MTDLIEGRRFRGALYTTHWHCVILFLGGNDLANCRDQDTLYRRYLDAFNRLRYDRLLLTDLEPRSYNREQERRHGIETAQHRALANVVNKKLKRHAKRNKNTVQLIHVPSGYMEDSRDGIHLSPRGEQKLILKYKKVINAYRPTLDQ